MALRVLQVYSSFTYHSVQSLATKGSVPSSDLKTSRRAVHSAAIYASNPQSAAHVFLPASLELNGDDDIYHSTLDTRSYISLHTTSRAISQNVNVMQLCLAIFAQAMLKADVCFQWKQWHLPFCVLLTSGLIEAYETYHKSAFATGRVQ